MCPIDSQDSDGRQSISHSPTDTSANSDVVFRMKSGGKQHLKNPPDTNRREIDDGHSTGFLFCNSDTVMRDGQEFESHLIARQDAEEEGEKCTDHNSGHIPTMPVVSFCIKEEKTMYPTAHQYPESEEIIHSSTEFPSLSIDSEATFMDHIGTGGGESNTAASSGLNKSVNSTDQQVSCLERSHTASEFGRSFSNQLDITSHHWICPGEEVDAGTEYGSSLNRMSNLVKKKRTHTSQKRYTWAECGRNARDSEPLRPNQEIHSGLELWICSQCGNCFSPSAALNVQQQEKNGAPKDTCSECEKSCHQPANLNKHRQKNTAEKTYICNECGKSFRYLQALMIHQRIHTGEKPYTCNECGRCFSDMGNLKRHQRIHSGEKPYACSQCGKNFRQLPHLIKHQRIHTGDKPYICNVCGRRFIDSYNLKRHQQIHTTMVCMQKETHLGHNNSRENL